MDVVAVTISWHSILSRGLLFALIWVTLTHGDPGSWWIGLPAILLATFASTALLPPGKFGWLAFLRFLPFFLIRSLLGGIDVAWRVFHPGLPIAPRFADYPLRLPPGLPQVFMASTTSLLPGTLSAELSNNCLKLHLLDGEKEFLPELIAIEEHVARLFGTPLPDPEKER